MDLGGIFLLSLNSRHVEQVQMLCGFSTVCGHVDPMFHQQGIFWVLHCDVGSVAHYDSKWDEGLCGQHFFQFILHAMRYTWFIRAIGSSLPASSILDYQVLQQKSEIGVLPNNLEPAIPQVFSQLHVGRLSTARLSCSIAFQVASFVDGISLCIPLR